jgi:glucose uptake protein GlcU
MNFNFGFDIIFLSIIAASTVGCFFLGEEKSQRLMIGTIVGVAASTQLLQLLDKVSFLKVNYAGVGMNGLLLLLPIVVVLLGKNTRDSKYPKSKIKAMIAGFLSSFTILGYFIANLQDSIRENIVTEYNLAAMAYDLRIIALALVIIWLFVMYLTVGKAKK